MAAQDRVKWRGVIHKGAALSEEKKTVKLEKSTESTKSESMCHHQSLQCGLALLATDRLELK